MSVNTSDEKLVKQQGNNFLFSIINYTLPFLCLLKSKIASVELLVFELVSNELQKNLASQCFEVILILAYKLSMILQD